MVPDRWSRRIDDGRPLPYVALVRLLSGDGRDQQFGSGILVDARHILTCFHVGNRLRADLPLRATTSTKLESSGDSHRIVVSMENHRDEMIATVVHEDSNDDLALLQLPCEIVGVRAPIERIPLRPGTRDVWICGYQSRERYDFIVHQRQLDPWLGKQLNGQQQSGEHSFGVEAGTSGGPIFAEGEDGQPVFLGIVDLGGLGSPTGHYVATDRIHKFLGEKGIVPDTCADGEIGRWSRIEGYSAVVKSRGPELVPDHRYLPVPDAGRLCFYGSRPIAAAIDPSKAHLPAAGRLAAHVPRPEDIDSLLARAREVSGLALRLPTEIEFHSLCVRAEAQRRVLGRPPNLQDYEPDQSFRAPPDTSAEWVEDGKGRRLCLFRAEDEKDVHSFADAAALAKEFTQARAAVRTVIDGPLS
uniref:Peptidase S1 and S6, chymotrypsin/Hap n=1 Tax=Rhodopseudomonas palustris (strain BisA53) TaxID=316055 RepID=Q07JF8_RHOP5